MIGPESSRTAGRTQRVSPGLGDVPMGPDSGSRVRSLGLGEPALRRAGMGGQSLGARQEGGDAI